MRMLSASALALCVAWAPMALAQTSAAGSTQHIPPSPLTLDAAVTRALAASPRTRAAAARLDAADGAAQQAGAIPNPVLGVEMENIRGTGPYRGFDSAETTYSLSQTMELGGKRGARQEAADAARAATRQDLTLARLDLTRDVRQAFADAVAAAALRDLATDGVRLAQETERSIRARVEAGREAAIQQTRAEIARRQADIALAQAEREERAATRALAALMGQSTLDIPLDRGWFDRLDGADRATPADANSTPELRRRQADLRRGRAELDLEKAKIVPDLTLAAGFRRFRENGDNAFTVGVSLPIPLFDQNRGNIAKARAELVAAEADLAAERLDLERRLSLAGAQLASARETVVSLRDQVLPTAEQAFADAGEAYRQGKFSYLDVLDAQRTLFDARRDLIAALRTYHAAAADLDRLTATPGGEE